MLLRLKFERNKKKNQTLSLREPMAPVATITEPEPQEPPKLPSTRPAVTTPTPGAPRIKTYTVEDIRQAMSMARKELGEEAILIATKRTDDGTTAEKQYEVTFGVVGGSAVPPPIRETKPAAVAVPETDRWADEFAALRKELSALQTELRRRSWTARHSSADNIGGRVYSMLTTQGISEDLASELASAVEAQTESTDGPALPLADELEQCLSKMIRVDSSVGTENKSLVLLGPPSSGKTTALIKIALEHGIKRGRDVQILSLGNQKTELNRTLEAMACALNTSCRTLSSAAQLDEALRSASAERKLVLLEATGYGHSIEREQDVATILRSGEFADVHLAIPAVWNSMSIRRAVDRFEMFQPSRLLFTMLDQAGGLGSAIQEALRTGKALSFFNRGPLGDGTLEPASIRSLIPATEDAA